MRILIRFENKPLLFQNPEFIVSCSNPSSFVPCFAEIESALKIGYYAAGFFSYESGYCFEERLRENKTYDFPLIYMGIYKSPSSESARHKGFFSKTALKNARLNNSREEYFSNITKIRNYIMQGDVYQITYCIKLLFNFQGDAFSFFNQLLRRQPVPYPAYIDTGGFKILSCSPEMFIKKKSGHVITRPMKGTWPRGKNIVRDLAARLRFQYDAKNRAENVMITDLLRNDLGRLGTNIKAPRLFEVSAYRTLYQMTSTVTATVDRGIPLYELFASLFPSGSVTGAPKVRAMQIIRDIESQERRIYTGAIGYITPNKDMFFNIPIRTLLIQGQKGEMGVGGGIVWDSTPQGEWEEGMLKAGFLTEFLE